MDCSLLSRLYILDSSFLFLFCAYAHRDREALISLMERIVRQSRRDESFTVKDLISHTQPVHGMVNYRIAGGGYIGPDFNPHILESADSQR